MPQEVKWAAAIAVGVALIWAGWKLPFILTTFHVLLCFILIVVILLQSGSAADLAGAFGGAGSQTAFGPRSAATFLTKATTWCAIMFMLTSATLSLRSSREGAVSNSILERTQTQQPAKKPAPTPAPQPPQQQPTPNPPAQAPAPAQPPPKP